MKTGNQRQFLLLPPRTLIVVGAVLIVSSLLDYAILLFPPNFLDRQWQVSFISQMVDRGIIPLVGLALLFTGLWLSNQVADRTTGNNFGGFLAIPALILSSILGLVFLLASPLHINNSIQAQQDTLAQIAKQADQATSQLDQSIKAQVDQERGRIQALLANPTELQKAIQSGQVSQQQAVLLQKFQSQPNSLDAFLQDESKSAKQKATEQLNKQKADAENKAKQGGLQSTLRTGLTSLFLAIGYAIVGWTGLREMRQ
jgi:hypothetical protein